MLRSKIFDVLDFYREPVYLCTCVNVYKYVRIISYGSACLSFTVCKRMLIFLGKVLREQSGKVDSHKQANLRHLLREALEWLSTLLHASAAHHKPCFPCFIIIILRQVGEFVVFSWGVIIVESGDCQRDLFKLGLSVPIRTLGVFVSSDATEGAFRRARRIQLTDIRNAKEVKLPRLAQPIVLISV